MGGADGGDVGFDVAAAKLGSRVAAQERKPLAFLEPCPQVLEAQGSILVSTGPEHTDHFTEGAKPAARAAGAHDDLARRLFEEDLVCIPFTMKRASVSCASKAM